MCIPRVQWKEVVMYFCLHAFWQSSVIIHKRLAAVTQIRESASCQKKTNIKTVLGHAELLRLVCFPFTVSSHRRGTALKVEACVWDSRTSED